MLLLLFHNDQRCRERCAALLRLFCRDQRRGRTLRSSSQTFPLRSRAWESTARLFSSFSAEIKGVGGHRAAILRLFHSDQRRGRTPRGSSPDFPLRSRAWESTARLFSRFPAEIKGVGERCEALLQLFYSDQRRGRTLRSPSPAFPLRSRAWEGTAHLFSSFSAVINGEGGHRAALLQLFYSDQRRGRTQQIF